ncbi:MAG: DUF4142 domain-containing protein [Chitinophagaceae bacterium]|nr:DUF4142 domain-containing protein [Chitinophagaceae bacterium]
MSKIIEKSFYLLFCSSVLLYSCSDSTQSEDEGKKTAEEQNDDKFNTKDSEKDAQFVVDVISGNYYEINLASYAGMHSSSADVKSMAKQMVDDHTSMVNQLKSIAASKTISVPMDDSTEVKNAIDDLHDAKPENFDKAWADKMLEKHTASISKLEEGLKDVRDSEIKAWIEGALPTVRKHYDMLNKLNEKTM